MFISKKEVEKLKDDIEILKTEVAKLENRSQCHVKYLDNITERQNKNHFEFYDVLRELCRCLGFHLHSYDLNGLKPSIPYGEKELELIGSTNAYKIYKKKENICP